MCIRDSNKTFGGLEYESSRLFDDYNYDLVGLAISGPIYKKTNPDGTKGNSVIGYFLSGEFKTQDDADPSAIGIWKVKDNVIADLKAEPFIIAPNADAGFLSTSDFLTEDDFENMQAREHSRKMRFNLAGKIDIKPAKNTFLSLGGGYFWVKERGDGAGDHSHWRSMFSSYNNRTQINTNWRVFGKLTQKFGSEESNSEKSANLIKNAFITLQADHSNNFRERYDENHKFNIFDYGHVGTLSLIHISEPTRPY